LIISKLCIILCEERELGIRASYTSDAFYEWNIDGLSEYEILNVLQDMLMVFNVYKTQKDPSVTDHEICNSLIIGFIGQLKGW
jgi:hypothetical protein